MNKNELRKQLLGMKIDGQSNKEASQEICRAFLNLPEYKKAKTVFCFVGTKSEIQTDEIIQNVLLSEKILCVPYCAKLQNGENIMQARQITSTKQLTQTFYNIKQPSECAKIIEPHEIDIAAVPCIAADLNGARLGYGGGYYDKFLPLMRQNALKAALCRRQFLQNAGVIPMESHDVFVDIVLVQSSENVSNKTC